MASLKFNEKKLFEKLFQGQSAGYVLDFSDRTFKDFFSDYNIDIEDNKYCKNGTSKMKRLRTFWEVEVNEIVGKVCDGLLEYANSIETIKDKDNQLAQLFISKLLGKEVTKNEINETTEDEFSRKEFKNIDLSLLNLDIQTTNILSQRIIEIEKCLKSNANLSVIFLCGSTLEGILLGVAINNPKEFNTAKSAFKIKDKVQPLHNWTLNALIDVAHEKGYIGLDVKKFSHALRDFRNFIHPSQQAILKFNPDNHTAKISWQVLQATIDNICGKR